MVKIKLAAIMASIVFILSLSHAVSMLPLASAQDILLVDPDNPGTGTAFSLIQEALDAIPDTELRVILIKTGVYSEDLLVHNDISAVLSGGFSPDFSVITGSVTVGSISVSLGSVIIEAGSQFIFLSDPMPPVITLNGTGPITLFAGFDCPYTEQGATAVDIVDGTFAATVGGDTVDCNTVGVYVVTYDATDAAGNAATQVTRTVNVVVDDSSILVDFNYMGTELGTQSQPYNTLAEAIEAVAVGGTITIKAGITSETFDGINKINKNVTIKSSGGTAVIGEQ